MGEVVLFPASRLRRITEVRLLYGKNRQWRSEVGEIVCEYEDFTVDHQVDPWTQVHYEAARLIAVCHPPFANEAFVREVQAQLMGKVSFSGEPIRVDDITFFAPDHSHDITWWTAYIVGWYGRARRQTKGHKDRGRQGSVASDHN